MQIFRRYTVYFLLGLVLLACGKTQDFLYRVTQADRETFSQTTRVKEMHGISKLDVLWVIDNSGSMMSHQKLVIDNSSEFMKAFTTKKALDWKMGMLSTHVGDKPYLGFEPSDQLDNHTPDPIGKFQNAIKKLGWNQGCPELVFEPIIDNLKLYPSFSRQRSVLVIMALTDTMEEVAGLQAKMESTFRTVKGDMKYVKFYGTFAGASFACRSSEPHWLYPGSPFEYFINLTGGKVFSLCDADFGKKLSAVGEDMASTVTHSKVNLKHRPIVDSLRVSYKGGILAGGPDPKNGDKWYYDFDLNSISFYDLDFTADENSEIDVTYDKLH